MLESVEMQPTSMIDVTQGLLHDAYQLAKSSQTGFYIYQSTIPISIQTRSVADEMKEDVDKYALYGGEDMEMLFTMPEDDAEKLHEKFDDFTIIGKITDPEEGMIMQTPHGEVDLFDQEEQ
jgi:thiamine-monophosphate kinase